MHLLLISSIVAIIIPLIIFILAYSLAIRSLNDREKTSPFECGFDPNHRARIPFSIRFFLLAIIFIVFDIEIVLLVPTPLLYNITNISIIILNSLIFLLILIIGLLHEWHEGSLDWSK